MSKKAVELDLRDVLQEEITQVKPGEAFLSSTATRTVVDNTWTLEELQRENVLSGASALCLSGGGIRSAAFSLGVVQGLAKRGYLHKFDYMFTVSGGGYTGSMLAAWMYRAQGGIREVVDGLRDATGAAADPVGWVRRYMKYLSPRLGPFSLDTWTLIATYLRNLFLNWLILLPLLGLIVAAPFAYLAGMMFLDSTASSYVEHDKAIWILVAGLFLVTLASYCLRWRTSIIAEDVRTDSRIGFDNFILSGMLLGAVLLTLGWYWASREGAPFSRVHIVIAAAAAHALAFVLFVFTKVEDDWKTDAGSKALHLAAGFVISGAVLGALLALCASLFPPEEVRAYPRLFFCWAPPAFLLCIVASEIIFAGVSSKASGDFHREWWSRVDAELLRASVAWAVLSTITLLLPAWIASLDFAATTTEFVSNAGVIGLIGLFGGVLARIAFLRDRYGKREEVTQTSGWTRYVEPAISVFSALFIVLLFSWLAARFEELACLVSTGDTALPCPGLDLKGVMTIAIASGVVLAAFSATININRFSLHAMYRERLIRAFLGGSRGVHPASVTPETEREKLQFEARRENPYTEFDPVDNPVMAWLRPGRELSTIPATDAKRPFLVIACALNLVATRNLAWQERKAASFTISPLHSGSSTLSDKVGFCRTADVAREADGITLGTALTISGAAVSPNAGYHSRPLITFLMTLFNARLGWWLGNPKDPVVRAKDSPTNAFYPMFRELFGRTDDEGDWIHLSDGGHFDNLGLYEAVIRGCKYIVAVDGSADPDRKFDDLGNAIRKIRVDLGIAIERQGEWLIGGRDKCESGRYCAVFAIRYEARLGIMEPGWLVYIKSALYPHPKSMVPTDVLNYAMQSPEFPHEPTGEQFYGEARFESYRALGEHEIAAILDPFEDAEDFDDLVTAAMEHAAFDDGAGR